MRTSFYCCLVAGAVLIAGCGEGVPADRPPEAPPPSADLFAGLPVLPGARIVSGTANAAEAVVEVQVAADSVARFYRAAFIKLDWAIRGDATAPDGTVTLHAASPKGRPVWVMIRPVSPNAAEVSLIAAAPTGPATDSAAARH
jgi:hypothetical protein